MAANAINNLFGAQSQTLGLGHFGTFGGLGLASSTKLPQLERYHEEHGWQKSSSKGKKGNVALSALTLLAFLFFLHILQNCIQEHMHEMKGDKYNGALQTNTTLNLPNVIVIGTGNNGMTMGRDNLKGDDGLLPLSEEELDQWPMKAHVAQKEAENRNSKPRAKKNNNKNQQKHKQYQNQQDNLQHKHQKLDRNDQTPVKNTIQGLVYPLDTHNFDNMDFPMHRIDNIP